MSRILLLVGAASTALTSFPLHAQPSLNPPPIAPRPDATSGIYPAGQNAIADMTASFGAIPDPFLQAVEIVRDLGPNITEAQFVQRTGITFDAIVRLEQRANALAADTARLQRQVESVRAEYAAVTRVLTSLRATMAQTETVESLLGNMSGVSLSLIRSHEQRARELMTQLARLDGELQANIRVGHATAKGIGGLTELKTALQRSGLVGFATGLTKAIEKYKLAPVFTVLGGIGSIQTVYTAASNLGTFDPGMAGDLKLTGNYETGAGNLKDVTLTLLGLGAAGVSGNPAAMLEEILTVSTGRLSDIYMAYTAWEAADAEAELAHRQYLLTLMRRNKLINQRQAAAIQADVARLGANIDALNADLDARAPNPARDPNWRDPRYDPATGLPIPSYWAYLRENSPESLVRMGIDPEAPVGGWPNGVRPQDRPRQAAAEQPRFPDGPGYPQARPRPRPAPANGVATEAEEAGGNVPADDGEVFDFPEDDEEAGDIVPVNSAEGRGGSGRAGLDLDVTPLEITPLDFEPVTMTPVSFEPPEWVPPVFEPPEWVPPEFDPPEPSQIPWTRFDEDDDDEYPRGADNLAYDFGDLSGTVATDLEPWREWLAGQDMLFLYQLAISAGYPNLASALADARNLMRRARDTGFRQWAWSPPVATGAIGLWASEAQRNLARAQIILGDLLGQSRDIFSTGGLSDIGISGLDLAYLLRDFGLQDGDVVDITLEQFGRTIFTTRLSLLNAGTSFNQVLRPGVARLVITAVNEGAISPNTAEIEIENVVRGESTQSYSLLTGEQAILRIESNAKGPAQ